MTKPIEDLYMDQLAQIEFAVTAFFDEHPDLTDAQVDSVYEELMKRYRAEATNFDFKPNKLDGVRSELHEALLPIAELLAGRPNKIMPFDVLSAEELRLCFQRLRRSIKTLKDAGGRQIYLQHIERHIP